MNCRTWPLLREKSGHTCRWLGWGGRQFYQSQVTSVNILRKFCPLSSYLSSGSFLRHPNEELGEPMLPLREKGVSRKKRRRNGCLKDNPDGRQFELHNGVSACPSLPTTDETLTSFQTLAPTLNAWNYAGWIHAFVSPHTQNTKKAITAHLLNIYSVYTPAAIKITLLLTRIWQDNSFNEKKKRKKEIHF